MYKYKIWKPNTHALILFNETQFYEQWKDEKLIENWEYLKTVGIIEKQKLSHGWTLYEFE